MLNKDDMGKRGTLIRRIGFYSVLASVMLLVLAACGTAETTGSATGNSNGQTATATTAAVAATPTAVEDMGGMTEVVPTATTEASATTTGAAPTIEPTATTAAGEGTQASASTTVQATLREWAIDLSVQEVSAGKITFEVTNQGQMAHNLTILSESATVGKTSNFRAADGVQTLEVELQPGTYTIICDLPGHAQRGQRTELVVK
jgi:uncharacterized cupredoxin-like copper-binding protein